MRRILALIGLLIGLWGTVAVAQIISGNPPPNVTSATGILLPANGGVGTMTGAPMWTRWFGNGEDGPGPASGAWGAAVYEQHFTTWTCTGAITVSASTSVIVRATGAVVLDTGCSITTSGSNQGNAIGDIGGAGGSGGAGAANSAASVSTTWWNPVGGVTIAASAYSVNAAASAGGAGNPANALTTSSIYQAIDLGYPFHPHGGGIGTAGGSSGGAPGAGGGMVVIIAPSIRINAGAIIDTSGAPGVAPVANSTGAGGGGGGGGIWLFSESFTDNGGIYRYGGGPGGAITQPSIQATGGGCDTTGCGTGAFFTVTGLTTGGLDASKITIAAAGSGYKTAPVCRVNAGGSGLVGSPACHFTISGGAIASVVIDTPGSGGTLTTFTTAFIGGYGANADYHQALIQ